MSRKADYQSGFTLIELIVVIIILGIIAIVAAPKFIDNTTEARKAVVEQTAGAIKDEVHMLNMKAQIRGIADKATGTLSVGGKNINLVYGYPASSRDNGLLSTVNIGTVGLYGKNHDNTRFNWVFQFIGREGRSGMDIGVGELSKDGSQESGITPEVARCFIRYYVATATLPAKVSVITDGC